MALVADTVGEYLPGQFLGNWKVRIASRQSDGEPCVTLEDPSPCASGGICLYPGVHAMDARYFGHPTNLFGEQER